MSSAIFEKVFRDGGDEMRNAIMRIDNTANTCNSITASFTGTGWCSTSCPRNSWAL